MIQLHLYKTLLTYIHTPKMFLFHKSNFCKILRKFIVNKMSPRPSLIPDLMDNSPAQSNNTDILEKDNESSSNISSEKNEGKTTTNRAGSCRVCLKSFKAEDFSKTCFECKYRVCEDCASYSKIDSSEDLVRLWL